MQTDQDLTEDHARERHAISVLLRPAESHRVLVLD
eukprot:CAMPEP_0119543602 /NCGR_PEP_ID=MMETSP1344-20130328/54217_1 /TAXON_ID=236787 /ORGANISM="Florenciella parvula, Strain CCMP2471" /LENGTH=34 /DNA_ID= /DNA_START= /DNA_END= /DNA_ORIENTATION=